MAFAKNLYIIHPANDGVPSSAPLSEWSDLKLANHLIGRDKSLALIARFGSLARALACRQPELVRVLGEEAAGLLSIVREATLRSSADRAIDGPRLANHVAVLDYLRVLTANDSAESFHVVFLNIQLRPIAIEKLGHGSISHAMVYPRDVVRRALELDATSIILSHNHPSGDPLPSQADINMTKILVSACKTVDIQVLDHFVVAQSGTASFVTLGYI